MYQKRVKLRAVRDILKIVKRDKKKLVSRLTVVRNKIVKKTGLLKFQNAKNIM